VVQTQLDGLDLVWRVRFSQLARTTKNGNRLHPIVEGRIVMWGTGGTRDTRKGQTVTQWRRDRIEEIARDALVLLHEEHRRLDIPYPTGWPVLPANVVQRQGTVRGIRRLRRSPILAPAAR
jgi:hypothetical protein